MSKKHKAERNCSDYSVLICHNKKLLSNCKELQTFNPLLTKYIDQCRFNVLLHSYIANCWLFPHIPIDRINNNSVSDNTMLTSGVNPVVLKLKPPLLSFALHCLK